jgi:hypothetical protein
VGAPATAEKDAFWGDFCEKKYVEVDLVENTRLERREKEGIVVSLESCRKGERAGQDLASKSPTSMAPPGVNSQPNRFLKPYIYSLRQRL